MANSQSVSKGNGASKRMSNPKHGITRARSWKQGQIRKAKHIAANLALHKEKVEYGGLGRRERRRIESGVRAA